MVRITHNLVQLQVSIQQDHASSQTLISVIIACMAVIPAISNISANTMLFYFFITQKQKQSTRQMYYIYCGCFIYSCWHLEEHSGLCLVCWYFGNAWQEATWSLLKWSLKHFMNGSSCLVTKFFAGLLGFTPLSFIAMSLTMIPTFSCAVVAFFRLCLSS